MKVFFINPIGAKSPYLFDTFVKTFQEQGHSVTENIHEATVAFFDSHSGYLPYDWNVLNAVLDRRMPCVYFDAFDYHCDSSEHWVGFNNWDGLKQVLHQDWAKFLFMAKDQCNPLVYFMRKMQTNADYGSFVYPLELIQFSDHDFPLTTKEELNSRPHDACFIGAKSPRREAFINSLQQDGRLKLDIQWTTERIPHDNWLNRHRQAKFFIEADGGGLGSERPYQLMPIAPMLKQYNLQLINNDWESLFDCVKISDVNSDTISILLDVLHNEEGLYKMYLRGNKRLKKYFNEEYRSNCILNILKNNGIC